MRVRLVQSVLVVTTLSLAGVASAHFDLVAPPSNNNSDNGGKGAPPCGPDVGSVVTPVTGGSMITIKVDETIPHPGHYRVALAIKSRDELDPEKGGLKEPVVKNTAGMVLHPFDGPGDSASAEIQNPPVFPVLADGIFAHTSGGGEFMTTVKLPNVNCDKCTLQVMEFMAKHGPDYFYRHCADLKITADPSQPIFDPTGGSGNSGGVGGASAGAAGSGGVSTAGSSTGGVPGSAGNPVSGAPGTAGTGTSGSATVAGGSGGITAPSAGDEGSCSVARAASNQRASFAVLASSLLVGLGWLARRRNRAE